MRDFDKLEGPQNDKLRRLTILDEPRFPTFLKGSDTKTGLTGPSLVIKPGVLKQGWTYIIEVKVFDTGEIGLSTINRITLTFISESFQDYS